MIGMELLTARQGRSGAYLPGVRWTPLWLLALLPLLLLLKTGSERRMEAGDLLAGATRQGRLPVVLPPQLTSDNEDEDRLLS